ncbi:MAG: hypothetical protein QM490_02185 [Candidatus Gracilibacteria bacterium]
MPKYIINRNPQEGGEHEFHNENICGHLPLVENRILLGNFNNCEDSKTSAINKWPNKVIDGCYWCTNCHTR